MQIVFQPQAKADLDFWVKSGNKSVLKKITQLIEAISEEPFEGIGKPEMLKHDLTGLWSRRINLEHRLIYELQDEKIIIHSLKGHY
ncbi:Txe/YoeB family addiction module toxin [Mucilaginibacter arboris]|uniref:Putative mRNA interferase YoeB n=1 Tax=Mucilaginibacter arboris TaxID=2682090 RepID=A0A7K1SWL6_9SPHI|nr:Txe/YoeB family addiction module toxin [Mucilaginibacter arboris]MVN21716.1 Txe/YoeB family addiction module toxin [Mucilaginibacter arboris]